MLQAELHTSTKPPAEWSAQGKVELKNYSLRYRPETDLVLKGINVSVRKGEKVCALKNNMSNKKKIYDYFVVFQPYRMV